MKFFYQWAEPDEQRGHRELTWMMTSTRSNTNYDLLKQMAVSGTGGAYVSYATVSLTLDPTNAPPAITRFTEKITGGGRTRYYTRPNGCRSSTSRDVGYREAKRTRNSSSASTV